jgi:hypothetical protein
MATQIDETTPENSIEDFQDIDVDLQTLIAKYITPIEQIRSRNAPNVSAGVKAKQEDQPTTGTPTNKEPQESRAHAFYRSLGLPIISEEGKYYNPGFNPKRTAKEKKDQLAISTKISSVVKEMQARRETDAKTRLNIFKNAGLDAAILSTAISIPTAQKPFRVMDAGLEDVLDKDLQIVSLPYRKGYLDSFYKLADGTSPGTSFNSKISHMLRPFTTDPVISTQLSPRTCEICVPFPETKEDTAIERNTHLKRCGLEFILRLRLRERNVLEEQKSSLSFSDIQKTIGVTGDLTQLTLSQIASVIQGKISDSSDADIKKALEASLYIELYTLNDLVRSLKGLVDLYANKLTELEKIKQKIIWTPLCSIKGPEGGTTIMSGFLYPDVFLPTWTLEKRIIQLKIKSQTAKMQQDIGNSLNFNDFIVSEFHNVSNVWEQELKDAEQQKSRYEKNASDILRTIELITGEISGLGLIDILAIWISLWSLDISVLLDLLDDGAADRLYKEKDLRTAEVESRHSRNGSVDIVGNEYSALDSLDSRIVNVLDFADKLFNQKQNNATNEEGGSVVGSM